MFIGYMMGYIYEKNVTVVEMIAASAYITALVCFSLEVDYGSVGLLKSPVHMQKHRVGDLGP